MIWSCWWHQPVILLEQIITECEAPGMRISPTKYEAIVLSCKRVDCHLSVGVEVLPQVEKFKYLGVSFMSGGKEWSGTLGKCGSVSRNVYTVLFCYCEKRSDQKGKALCVLVDLYSYLYLW